MFIRQRCSHGNRGEYGPFIAILRATRHPFKLLSSGFGMVEILVAVFIFSLILGSLIAATNTYLSSAADNLKSTEAAYLAEEGVEAVKIIRDTGWNNITAIPESVDYYLYFDNSSSTNNMWNATSTFSQSNSVFVRSFQLHSVYRDSNGRIVDNGGTLDPNSKKVSVFVSWSSRQGTTTKNLSAYITNIFE